MEIKVSQEEIEKLFRSLKKDAESYGYNLNPDEDFTKALVRGLIINSERYGYPSCPCRLSTGKIDDDRDIICPCDYRDADINDFGACYCGLYVDEEIKDGTKKLVSIPERRYMMPSLNEEKSDETKQDNLPSIIGTIFNALENKKLYIWRCKVCGYLCAREKPPGVCPICKVKQDRFERIF